jgi:hypothetical protein
LFDREDILLLNFPEEVAEEVREIENEKNGK